MEGVAPERGVISGGGGPGDDADAGIAETGCVVRRMPSVANLHRDIAQALKHLGRSHRPLPSSHATLGALCFLQGKKARVPPHGVRPAAVRAKGTLARLNREPDELSASHIIVTVRLIVDYVTYCDHELVTGIGQDV